MITAIFGGDERRAKLVFSQWKTGGPTLFYKVIIRQLHGRVHERRVEHRDLDLRVRARGLVLRARLGRRPARRALARRGLPRRQRARLAGRRRGVPAGGRRDEAACARAGSLVGGVVKLIALLAVALLDDCGGSREAEAPRHDGRRRRARDPNDRPLAVTGEAQRCIDAACGSSPSSCSRSVWSAPPASTRVRSRSQSRSRSASRRLVRSRSLRTARS